MFSNHQGVTFLKHLPDLPRASESQTWASILKDQEITVARIGQAKSVLWTMYNFHTENDSFSFFWGK